MCVRMGGADEDEEEVVVEVLIPLGGQWGGVSDSDRARREEHGFLVKDTQLIDSVKPLATGEEHKTAVLLGNGAGSGLCAFKTPLKCILDDEYEGATWRLLRPGQPK